jgi:hypothetical protein
MIQWSSNPVRFFGSFSICFDPRNNLPRLPQK